MARTAAIKLDGKDYTVHAFNMKELQEVGEILNNANNQLVSGLKILAIAMKRAEPKCEDFNAMEPSMDELREATNKILGLSGIDTNPQTAAPANS